MFYSYICASNNIQLYKSGKKTEILSQMCARNKSVVCPSCFINLKDVSEDSKSLNETNYQSMSRDEAILKNIFVKAVV